MTSDPHRRMSSSARAASIASLWLAVSLLAGCATCKPEKILQLSVHGESPFKVVTYDKNAADLFLTHELVSLWLQPCHDGGQLNEHSLCAQIFSPPSGSVALQDSQIRVVTQSTGAEVRTRIERITFVDSCSSADADAAPCRPDMRGVKTPAQVSMKNGYRHEGRYVRLFEISLDPLATLPGGSIPGEPRPLQRWGVYAPYALEAFPYSFRVGDGFTGDMTLILPAVQAGGKTIVPPPVRVAPVMAEVCRRPPI